MKAQLLIDRVGRLRRILEPKQKPVMMLPTVYLNEHGNDWPGSSETNIKTAHYAAARRVEVKEYLNIPEDGIEP